MNEATKFYLRCKELHIKNKNLKTSYRVIFKKSEDNFHQPNASNHVCVIQLYPQWSYYLLRQLHLSKSFTIRFFSWILIKTLKSGKENNKYDTQLMILCEHCQISITKTSTQRRPAWVSVQLESTWEMLHTLEPDISWSVRVLQQTKEQLQLEAAFAWLSTLGGAHSALGNYFHKNAKVACELSMKQLYIATKIGSPILATHCKLYFAMSLMQQGQYKRASKIISSVWRNIMNDKGLQEKKLINCYKASKVRLKHLQINKHRIRHGDYGKD
ncbi:uncharacterized protein LOC124458095 isoform X2 [Xenia sp. Carnegie-2017]|uniref:uncharacterized protein LOC124458095 isoform X2 n=1 Tax=Xenia sp. Carnegie-2017 TaxID=2897299 RepID=UPI001F042C05|nr:uncharacterized protein LOC124458095 isoform X2 [Xenia sp. Carnegie-2017]